MYCAPGGGLVSTAPMAIPQPSLQYHNPYTAQAQQVPGGGGRRAADPYTSDSTDRIPSDG